MRARRGTWWTWALRVLVALLPVMGLLCTTGAGEAPPGWLVVLVLALGLGWAAFPESVAGAAAIVTVLAWWGVGLRDGLEAWALPAAAALLAAHVAAVLLSYGPPQLQLDGPTLRLWLRRGALVYVLAPVTFGLAVWVRDEPAPTLLWAAGLAAAFASLLAASVVLSVYADEPVER
jgi:hypothetical protein